MRSSLVILFVSCLSFIYGQHYGSYMQYADINFENGTVSDALGNANAVLQNGAAIVDDTERGNKVVQFNADQKGNIKFNNSPLNDEMTIAFWFKREDTDPLVNWRMIFAFYAANGSNVYFTPRTSWGENAYLIYNNTPFSIYKTAMGSPVTNQKWTHYAVVFDNDLMKVYQDGELKNSTSLLGKLSDINAVKWFLGNNPELNFPMTGKMDDVKIFHAALANNQIKAIYENKPIPNPTDDVRPFVRLPLDYNWLDVENNVETSASNVTFTTDSEKGKVGVLNSGGRISFIENPFGAFKYSLAMMLKKESLANDDGKVIYKTTASNGDYFGLRIKYADNKALIDLVSFQNNTLTLLGTTSSANPLIGNKWNSIVFVQTFSTVGTPALRMYINGISSFIKTNVNLHEYGLVSWHIGSDDEHNLTAMFDDIRIYQRELLSTEVANYHNSQVNTTEITANFNNKLQTIRNFGSSDGWNTQFVGLYFNEEQKEKLAELIFSKEKDSDGSPKGIGLSAWRFNIGSGTSEQGTASRITAPERRTECFRNADGSYNWNKQAGQRWFLEKAAKTYQVPDIIGWQNSPPVHYTVRGLGFREYGDPKQSILKTQHYADFGKFLADVVQHFKQQGININYVSPLNEPQHDWMPPSVGAESKQEGSPWTNTEIKNVVNAISNQFVTNNVDAKLFLAEAGSINNLLSGTGVAQNQLAQLWTPSHSNFIGSISKVDNIVSSHSYFQDTSADLLVNTRKTLKDRMTSLDPNLEFWQTEYCLLANGYLFGHPTERTLTPIESAISLARVIHTDLAVANATAWQWWTTFEFEKHLSSEDRFALIRVALNSDNTAGIYQPTKLLYALGHYAHFIRPGMKRLDIQRSDNMTDANSITNTMVSAYLNESSNEIVFVVINHGTAERSIRLAVDNLSQNMNLVDFTPYITSDNDNLKKYPAFPASENYLLPAGSIVTFVGKVNEGTTIFENNSKKQFHIYPNPSKNFINISFEESESKSILRITDISGSLIEQKTINNYNSSISIDLTNYSNGVYIITLENTHGKMSKKLIIAK